MVSPSLAASPSTSSRVLGPTGIAILGIDRLGLTSEANPTIFGSLVLTGIALNGIAWILLGFDVATRHPSSEPLAP